MGNQIILFLGAMYFTKTPFWLKQLYSNYVWDIPTRENILFLTFDDGPHPVATPFVLDELKKFGAKATFFCIGKNVVAHPGIYARILAEGHAVGNHTHNHLNGWKTPHHIYSENIHEASQIIDSKLFRPPYGRITRRQGKSLLNLGYQIVMWDVLSGDFDAGLKPAQCSEKVAKKSRPGSVIVFHDSEKAFRNMRYTLSETLRFFSGQGYRFESIC